MQIAAADKLNLNEFWVWGNPQENHKVFHGGLALTKITAQLLQTQKICKIQ